MLLRYLKSLIYNSVAELKVYKRCVGGFIGSVCFDYHYLLSGINGERESKDKKKESTKNKQKENAKKEAKLKKAAKKDAKIADLRADYEEFLAEWEPIEANIGIAEV